MSTEVLILNSGRCSWHRCVFCGYGKISGIEPSAENVIKKFEDFFSRLKADFYEVKIFGSGSFLDEKQVPEEAREYFIKKCREHKIKKLTIESRPEFITREKLKEFQGTALTVAIGLEVADDKILKKLDKGFSLKDFENAAKTIHDSGAKLRAYLIVNAPFIKNLEKSLCSSVDYAKKFADSIVMINLLPHQNAELMKMWLDGEWNFLSKEKFAKITERYANEKNIDIDAETFRFVPQFNKETRMSLVGVGEEYLTNPYYEVWQDYLQRWYTPPKEKDVLLFLPCSYKKPYSESETHRAILNVLRKSKDYEKIHQVMISSPGVIPREFENYYPFNAYDWDEKLETKEVKERYTEVIADRIEKYLKVHGKNYEKVFCYLKYSAESYNALEIACKNLGLRFKNLLKKETYERVKNDSKALQSEIALKDLEDGLKNG